MYTRKSEYSSAEGTTGRVARPEPFVQAAGMELVLTRPALLGRYRPVLGTDNRVANSAVFHTIKVQSDVATEHSQRIHNVAILRANHRCHREHPSAPLPVAHAHLLHALHVNLLQGVGARKFDRDLHVLFVYTIPGRDLAGSTQGLDGKVVLAFQKRLDIRASDEIQFVTDELRAKVFLDEAKHIIM